MVKHVLDQQNAEIPKNNIFKGSAKYYGVKW